MKVGRRILLAAALGLSLAGAGVQTAAAQQMELMQPGELVIGYYPTAGGFDVKDGKVEGVFGLVIDKVAQKLNLKPVYKAFDFPALIPALQAGRVDVAGPFSITQPRAQVVYLTTPMFLQPEAMAVREGTKLSSWEEAAEKKLTLATNVGYFQIEIWEKLGIKVHTFDNVDACFMDVVNGGADGCEVGAFDLIYRQATQPDSPVAKLDVIPMSGPQITADLNSYGVSKNSPVLAAAVSQAITDLWRDGSIEAAYRATFKDAAYDLFLNAPAGHALYAPGPWEDGVVPPALAPAPVQTVADGLLTVGVPASSPLLATDGEGAEGQLATYVASLMGLKPKFVSVKDAVADLNDGRVDIIAGQFEEVEELSTKIWYSQVIAFNPDYIYVAPNKEGGFPGYTSWQEAIAEGLPLVAVSGGPRIDDLKASGVPFKEAKNVKEALAMVAAGQASGFVGSTVDFVSAVSSDAELVETGFGWVRNKNSQTRASVYGWGIKAGNAALADALDRGITAAWQSHEIGQIYRRAFPGTDVTALLAPGPTAIGTSYGASKDFKLESAFLAGPWTQRKGWSK